MSHFNLKSLAFYGTAITSVVVLFKIVTAYGNANLKAPPFISGVYRISSDNLPECLKSNTLVLNIQQSGIYLVGTLNPESIDVKSSLKNEQKPSLNGRFINQQLSLEGTVPELKNCNNSIREVKDKSTSNGVKIQGLLQGETLIGQIILNSTPAVEFSATREPVVEESRNEHR